MNKKILSLAGACAAAAAFSAPALADTAAEPTTKKETKAEIVERGPDGRATSVMIDGKVYAICKEGSQDDCINPRDAGLDWGNRELEYWPGKPASEIETPLPPENSE